MTMILGISAYYHDSAACLLRDGVIVAAAQEERFSRRKHDPKFPENAVRYCIREAGIYADDIDYVAFYDKPFLKFERLLETYLRYAPRGLTSFVKAMPVWVKEKLLLRTLLERELNQALGMAGDARVRWRDRLFFPEHHLSHAASAFYPSPFDRAAILTVDGVGEWVTTSAGAGDGHRITLTHELHFPHSLGLLYSAFTYYTGFKVNSGEYKVMGLAPYGEPKYVRAILDHLVDLKDDGSFALNQAFFGYATGLCMTGPKFDHLFGGPPRKPESELTQREMDLARSVQEVTEEIMLRMARFLRRETGEENLCLAGGVALNCVANGRLLREGIFKDLWIQPAAGDAGGALGAALAAWHLHLKAPRAAAEGVDAMRGAYLGPEFSGDEIDRFLWRRGAPFRTLDDEAIFDAAAELIAAEKVVGWFQGRMEFGPRALGNRSILGDARSTKMQSVMNLKIKYRESFRPFAPSVLGERVAEYFEMDHASPYMLLVANVQRGRCLDMGEVGRTKWGIDLLNVPRSDIPAVTHIDYSARVQTVHRETNPRYWSLIERFRQKTGCATIVNTSFNVRGEPIVCTPEDAYRCFMRTEMDALVLGNHLLLKTEQPAPAQDSDWRREFELD